MKKIATLFKSQSQEDINEIPQTELKKQYCDMRKHAIAIEEELELLRLQLQSNSSEPTLNDSKKDLPGDASASLTNKSPQSYAHMVNNDLDKLIKNLLQEIREYDGSSHPEPFKKSAARAILYFSNNRDRAIFTRRLVAQKIKGRAIPIVDRIDDDNLSEVIAALETAFGSIELDFDQLSETRNRMRQGINESIKNYILRYEEIHLRLQRAIDALPKDDRESQRRMEKNSLIKKFVRSLKPELEIRVANERPPTLRHAFNVAQQIDKQLKEDATYRRQQNIRPQTQSTHTNRPQVQKPVNPIITPHSQFSSISHTQTRTPLTKEEGEARYFCEHCKIRGHTIHKCFKLHPERRPNFSPRQHVAETPPEENTPSSIPESDYEAEQYYISEISHKSDTVPAFW